MKDEIKEILDNLKFSYEQNKELYEKYNQDVMRYIIHLKEAEVLLDYITNLQEENNSLKQMSKDTYDTSQEIIFELQEELKSANDSITWWTNRFNAVQRDYEDYKSRCEKAIEYLEQPYRDDFDFSKAQLLSILQGEDNE